MATVDLLEVNCYMIAIQTPFICHFARCFSASDVTSNKVRLCGRSLSSLKGLNLIFNNFCPESRDYIPHPLQSYGTYIIM